MVNADGRSLPGDSQPRMVHLVWGPETSGRWSLPLSNKLVKLSQWLAVMLAPETSSWLLLLLLGLIAAIVKIRTIAIDAVTSTVVCLLPSRALQNGWTGWVPLGGWLIWAQNTMHCLSRDPTWQGEILGFVWPNEKALGVYAAKGIIQSPTTACSEMYHPVLNNGTKR